MVLTGVLFVVFLAGTITAAFVAGAVAWLVRHPVRGRPWAYARPAQRMSARAALDRHPAGRAWVKGPDDDPEFLQALDRIIRGGASPGE